MKNTNILVMIKQLLIITLFININSMNYIDDQDLEIKEAADILLELKEIYLAKLFLTIQPIDNPEINFINNARKSKARAFKYICKGCNRKFKFLNNLIKHEEESHFIFRLNRKRVYDPLNEKEDEFLDIIN